MKKEKLKNKYLVSNDYNFVQNNVTIKKLFFSATSILTLILSLATEAKYLSRLLTYQHRRPRHIF